MLILAAICRPAFRRIRAFPAPTDSRLPLTWRPGSLPIRSLPTFNPGQVNLTGNPANAYVDPSYGRPGNDLELELRNPAATGYGSDSGRRLRGPTLDASVIEFRSDQRFESRYFKLGSLLNAPANSAQAQAAGVKVPYAGFPKRTARVAGASTYPQFYVLNTDCCLENLGQSTYNALQASVRRRFHSGLNLLAAYTWSKYTKQTPIARFRTLQRSREAEVRRTL